MCLIPLASKAFFWAVDVIKYLIPHQESWLFMEYLLDAFTAGFLSSSLRLIRLVTEGFKSGALYLFILLWQEAKRDRVHKLNCVLRCDPRHPTVFFQPFILTTRLSSLFWRCVVPLSCVWGKQSGSQVPLGEDTCNVLMGHCLWSQQMFTELRLCVTLCWHGGPSAGRSHWWAVLPHLFLRSFPLDHGALQDGYKQSETEIWRLQRKLQEIQGPAEK